MFLNLNTDQNVLALANDLDSCKTDKSRPTHSWYYFHTLFVNAIR